MLRHVINFFIGFFAGICAVFVPRMISILSNAEGGLQFFKTDYLVLGAVFSVIIGGVTVIFGQARQKTAAETFMTALGIPALLSGALNTGTMSNDVKVLQMQKQQLEQKAAQTNGIQIDEGGASITPLTQVTGHKDAPFDFSIIPSAWAEGNEPSHSGNDINFSVLAAEKKYVIVLDKTTDKNKAARKAKELRKLVPQASVVQSGKEFMVVDSPKPQSKTNALLRAIDLKNKYHQTPSLLQVK